MISSTIPDTLARGASLTELRSSATASLTACEDSSIESWYVVAWYEGFILLTEKIKFLV